MARNKSHGLNENDVLSYNDYLDKSNGEMSPDTAPTLIPVLVNGNVTMKSYAGLLAEEKAVEISNESLTVDNLVLSESQEGLTDALRVISTDHGYIHEGIGYKTYFEIGNLAGTEEFLIFPNNTKFLHFKNLELMALGGTVKATILRGTTANPLVIDSVGAVASEVIGPNNLNDVTNNQTSVVITKTPTYVTAQAGEPWAIIQVLGDSTNQFTSVAKTQTNTEEEFVMKANIPYVIKLEKIGLDTPTNVLLTSFWYEELGGTSN